MGSAQAPTPEKGAKAAQDHQSDIEEALKGADTVFVTCGEGGGTGTGASPIVARAAHQQGALTIAVVTRPFSFEGPQRAASAKFGIENLRQEVDALIVIPNDRLLELSDRSITIMDAFKTADGALLSGVQGITDLITSNSYIHVDFSDVTAILRGAGTALFGIGSARGERRATQAAELAISSPLLEESIEGADAAMTNVAGPTDIGLQEASAAVELVRKAIHPEAQIIWVLPSTTPMATKCASPLSRQASTPTSPPPRNVPHRRRSPLPQRHLRLNPRPNLLLLRSPLPQPNRPRRHPSRRLRNRPPLSSPRSRLLQRRAKPRSPRILRILPTWATIWIFRIFFADEGLKNLRKGTLYGRVYEERDVLPRHVRCGGR